ncbi:MAG TPA: hypothetical protein VIV63_14350 [Steroidobacteraceae bacterium]
MKILPALLIACGALAVAHARPVVIQESARIGNPDPTTYPYFASDVAIDGDDAIATLERYIEPGPDSDPRDIKHDVAVYLFRRTGTGWAPVRQLVVHHHGVFNSFISGLAMRNGIAALALNPLYVFERRDGDWVSAPVTGVNQEMPGDSINIDGSRILFGGSSGTWLGTLYEKNSTGVWGPTSLMWGDYRGGDDEFTGGPVDISGGRAVVMSPSNEEEFPVAAPAVTVFRDWGAPDRFLRQSDIRSTPAAPLGYEVAIRGDEIFIAGNNASGTRVFRPGESDQWDEFDKLQPLDSFMGGGVTTVIEKNHLFVMQRNWNAERDAYVINVFRKPVSGPYEHVATLVSSDGSSLNNFGISSRRVIANCGNEACYFELPASLNQPAPVQHTFAAATPTGWATSAGSAFSIVQRGISRVLRQSDVLSPATHSAVLSASDWTNQSVQADVRPLAFAAGDCWQGLATRYRDAGNYYFVSVTSSSVSLRRVVGGVLTTVSTIRAAIPLNRPYRLRLESIGTRHRVYLNGAPLLDADDSALASGRAALLTHRSSAEFDNVVASPTPATILYSHDFTTSGGPTDLWAFTGAGLWRTVSRGSNFVFAQSSVAGVTRAVTGVPTDDQSVDVRARPTTFAGTGSGERWFGVMARYVDEANYYYLSLRSTNTVSLRKLTNGAITELGTYALPVTLGAWYQLRLEAVGSQIRGYVNGFLVAEATDTTHARGAAGPITNRAAVDFDDYRAIQP